LMAVGKLVCGHMRLDGGSELLCQRLRGRLGSTAGDEPWARDGTAVRRASRKPVPIGHRRYPERCRFELLTRVFEQCVGAPRQGTPNLVNGPDQRLWQSCGHRRMLAASTARRQRRCLATESQSSAPLECVSRFVPEVVEKQIEQSFLVHGPPTLIADRRSSVARTASDRREGTNCA
jgi:hypothetical protein